MSTVSLQMIVKDEFDEVEALLKQVYQYFDSINITVSDEPTFKRLAKVAGDKSKVEYRPWNNRFDDARNDNLKLCDTDYFFWLDADDEFDFRAIPKLVEIADEQHIDAIFLPYNYAQDDDGNCITRHWRERLIRRSAGFEWRGWIHESLISDTPYTSHKVNQEVKHLATREHAAESLARNHVILEKAFMETEDPRYAHYLGLSYFTMKDYSKCIEVLLDYIQTSGNTEDVYRSLSIIAEACYHLGNIDKALEYAAKASILIPEYPHAYWLLAQFEADQENWNEAIEWVRVSESKPDPETLAIWDPTARERAALIGARCEFTLGNFNAALAWLRKAPNNEMAQSLYNDFQQEADAETFVKMLPNLRKFFKDDKTLWESLAYDLQYDKRLQALRYNVTEPKTWSDKSIVIFCGQGYEEWGPHTMDKGMGGSEEAVVYLSRELARLGYEVTVYAEATEYEKIDGRYVDWFHWKEFDTRDNFNVFVAWRAPQYAERVNAKVKLADIHDVLPKRLVKDYPDVTYMVKSNFHRKLYPDVPDNKFRIIGNGISKEQF